MECTAHIILSGPSRSDHRRCQEREDLLVQIKASLSSEYRQIIPAIFVPNLQFSVKKTLPLSEIYLRNRGKRVRITLDL